MSEQERMVHSLMADAHLQRGLALTAAAAAAGLQLEEVELGIQRLLVLMPFLERGLLRLPPRVLGGLAADPERAGRRLIALRAELPPTADVAALLSQRPSLLLEPDWPSVGATRLDR
eukprot:scaffold1.g5790.t1